MDDAITPPPIRPPMSGCGAGCCPPCPPCPPGFSSAAGDVAARLSAPVYEKLKKEKKENWGAEGWRTQPFHTPPFHTDVDRAAGLIITAEEW